SAATTPIFRNSGIALRVPILAEPIHCTAKRVIHRTQFPTQFALSLLGRNEHFFSAHSHRINRCARFLASYAPGYNLVHYSGCQRHNIRNSHRRRFQSRNRRQLVENLLQRQILSTQYVALTALAFLKSLNMSVCTFVDIDQVQASINVRGKFALEKVHDDPPGWSWLDISFSNWSCRIYDHYVHS